MATVIYGLCALTALLCTGLLLQAYFQSRYKLLLWGGLCFAALSINNIILVTDKVFLPHEDLSMWRLVTAMVALVILLYGLIWDAE
jgi:hypothetical protein